MFHLLKLKQWFIINPLDLPWRHDSGMTQANRSQINSGLFKLDFLNPIKGDDETLKHKFIKIKQKSSKDDVFIYSACLFIN